MQALVHSLTIKVSKHENHNNKIQNFNQIKKCINLYFSINTHRAKYNKGINMFEE